jgi:inhibitor of KinA sporulation pathway (predicted exonuclease)
MRALLVVDLEATCWERPRHVPRDMEIIEIGALRVDLREPGRWREFQGFVRPAQFPVLSEFCTRLTTIRQEEVDAAPAFPAALAAFQEWCGDPAGLLFASWGTYDRNQLWRDCARHGRPYPFDRHLDLKRLVARHLGRKPASMEALLAALGLEPEGTLHRGIDDARNIWRIARATVLEPLVQACA